MRQISIIGALLIILIGAFFYLRTTSYEKEDIEMQELQQATTEPTITPISHATMVLSWDGGTIITDPVGGAEAFAGQPEPNIILITDIHGDHLNAETITAIATDQTHIIAPQAVFDELPQTLQEKTIILANGATDDSTGFSIEAIPMYNLPEADDAFHTKGRGNGYIIEHGGKRVYVAGDTAGIPEMRALENIDIAFIPMNLPYTMSVDDAADAVLDFAPRHVYPYHYRGPDGLADVERFKELITSSNPDIDVVLLDWYQAS